MGLGGVIAFIMPKEQMFRLFIPTQNHIPIDLLFTKHVLMNLNLFFFFNVHDQNSYLVQDIMQISKSIALNSIIAVSSLPISSPLQAS